MKRRMIALLLALTLLCTGVLFTGCGNGTEPEVVKGQTAFEVINAALEKTENLDSMAAQMKMEINMTAAGLSLSIPITMNLKGKGMKSTNPIISTDVSMSIFGQSMEFELYQEGGWTYMVMGDMKYKAPVSDETDDMDYAESFDEILKKIPESVLKDVELVKAADGSQTATISFPAELFAEVYEEFVESVNSETGTDAEEMQISDAVVKITVADGYITVYDLSFKMGMTVEGVSTSAEAKATITYDNPGKDVTITSPEGYQSFEETTGLFGEA